MSVLLYCAHPDACLRYSGSLEGVYRGCHSPILATQEPLLPRYVPK